MHSAVVIDASVWVSYFVQDDLHYRTGVEWVDNYVSRGGRLTAPGFLIVEVAAAISRRTGLSTVAKQAVRYTLYHSSIRLIPMDPSLLSAAAEVAADLHLKAGDATYVVVARKAGIPLLSWDHEQLERASSFIKTYKPDSYPF